MIDVRENLENDEAVQSEGGLDAASAEGVAAIESSAANEPDVSDWTEEKSTSESGPGVESTRPQWTSIEELKSIVESIVFVSEKPVTVRQLAKATRSTTADLQPVLAELVAEYEPRGIELVEVSGGYQFRSAARNSAFVRAYLARRPVRLSRAQLETLAIVAYRQPITRPEIDEIRGVDSGSALKLLGERGLIKVLGRKDEPGRPLLYGTAPPFFELFGLAGLKDLPTLTEFLELSEDSRELFERRMGEPLDLQHGMSELDSASSEAEADAQEELLADTEEEATESFASDEELAANESSSSSETGVESSALSLSEAASDEDDDDEDDEDDDDEDDEDDEDDDDEDEDDEDDEDDDDEDDDDEDEDDEDDEDDEGER